MFDSMDSWSIKRKLDEAEDKTERDVIISDLVERYNNLRRVWRALERAVMSEYNQYS